MIARVTILLLIPHLGGGGAERITSHLARMLSRERFDVHLGLITPDSPGALGIPDWVTVHRFGLQRIRQTWRPLLRLIREVHPQIILSGMAHLNFLLLLLKPALPSTVRLIVRQNTTASSAGTNWRTRLCYRFLYPRADRILCQSKAMASDLIHHFGIPEKKLVVLANPIAIPERQASGAEVQGIQLLAVGRLSSEKGFDLLLRAMVEVVQQYPQSHVSILGTGAMEAPLLALREELKLDRHVTFAGYADPDKFYAQTTLFVLPSRFEGMPNALLEAAAAGLPIVATPCCEGVSDLLRDAPGTWMAKSVSAESLAKALLSALGSILKGELARPRFHHGFLEPFAMPTAIAAYESLLLEVARECRP